MKLCWILPHFTCLHRSRQFILGALRRAQKLLRLVALSVSPTIVDHDSTNFVKTVSLCYVVECMYVFAFKLICFDQSFFGATFAVHLICQVGFVIGNPSGSRLEILGRKRSWKNGSSSMMSILMNRPLLDDPVFQSTDYIDCIPGATRIPKQCDPGPCETTILRDQPYFWERLEAPLPPLRSRPKCDFIHPQQLRPFPERLELPFSSVALLSGY